MKRRRGSWLARAKWAVCGLWAQVCCFASGHHWKLIDGGAWCERCGYYAQHAPWFGDMLARSEEDWKKFSAEYQERLAEGLFHSSDGALEEVLAGDCGCPDIRSTPGIRIVPSGAPADIDVLDDVAGAEPRSPDGSCTSACECRDHEAEAEAGLEISPVDLDVEGLAKSLGCTPEEVTQQLAEFETRLQEAPTVEAFKHEVRAGLAPVVPARSPDGEGRDA